MAKIIKVGSQNLTPNKIANPFKTSRNSTTNPFKYNNFEGNTLPFELAADVFSGAKSEKTNKLRMIASSVAGSMNKMKSSITEPIVNFVNRVRGGISSAWDYAKNTNISDIPGIKQVNDVLNTEINMPSLKGIGDVLNTEIHLPSLKSVNDVLNTEIHLPSFKGLSDSLTSRVSYLNKDIVDIGKDIHSAWDALIAKIPSKTHYTSETPVAELRAAWIAENEKEQLALGGVA